MDTKLVKIDELQSVFSNENETISRIHQFMQPFTLGVTLKNYSQIKQKGYSLTDVLIWLCSIQAMGLSIYQATRQEFSNLILCGEKCVYYRLLENQLINWRGLYRRILLKYYEIVKSKGEEPQKGSIRCFIIDDTVIEKTGKYIEGVTKVFDHVTHKSVLGLKMLVLGYWDGLNFLGVDFTVHRELGKNNKGGLTNKEQRLQHKKVREKDSCTAQRKKELDESKIDAAIKMLKRADKLGLLVDYVLTDSWFTCIELIKVVRSMLKGSVHFLGMVVMNRHKFEYNGKLYTTSGLIALLERKSSHYSRKFKCKYIDVVAHYQGVEFRLFLIKYGTKGKFRAVLTTNVKLDFVEMMNIYKIRWSIEVFFKECKQYLKLGKYQSTNFDGQIASLTITMITHTVLTLEKRFRSYQTMGELFRETQKHLLELTLWERLNIVIIELINFLIDLFEIDIDELMERIINNEQYEKQYNVMLIALMSIKQQNTYKQAV
jgi:Transposase DDE domain